MRRWVWRILLTAVMMTLLAGTAMAAEINGIQLTANGSEWTVTRYTGSNTKVEIPNAYDEKPVTAIGANAFGSSAVTSVTIPESVTRIGEKAFFGSGLTAIEIPGTVTTIEESAFEQCENLKSVKFLDAAGNAGAGSKTTVGKRAFAACKTLSSLKLTGNVGSIGDEAFKNCSVLGKVIIWEGTTSVGADAFSLCENLNRVVIASSATLAAGAFTSCKNLQTVHYAGSTKPDSAALPANIKDDDIHRVDIDRSVGVPTCLKSANVVEKVGCTVAGCTFSHNETETLPALGHDLVRRLTNTPPAASCQSWTKEYEVTCTRVATCGYTPTVETEFDPGDGNHNWGAETTDTVAATCTAPGVETKSRKCTSCGAEEITSETVLPIDDTNHVGTTTTETVTVDATCDEDGYTQEVTTCDSCGKEISLGSKTTIPKLGHEYKGGKTIDHAIAGANCSHKGYTVTYKVCDTCGKAKECTDCQDIVKRLTEHPAEELTDAELAHLNTHGPVTTADKIASHTRPENVKSTVTLEPKCTIPGTRVYDPYKCTLCGKEIKDITELTEEIAPLGHEFEAGAPVTTAPTCTQPGIVTVTHTCTRENCDGGLDEDHHGHSYTVETTTPAAGHKWGDFTVTSVTTEPTCVAGKAVGTAKCTVCGIEETGIEIELEPVSAHTYGEWTVEDGKRVRVCTVCGNKQNGGDVTPGNPDTPTDPDTPTNPDTPTGPDTPTTPTTPTTYSINMISTSNGSVTASVYSARSGDVVTLTVRPNSGYELDWLRVSLASTGAIRSLDGLGGGQYRFTMPAGNVEVRAAFAETYVPSWSTGSAITSTGATSRWTDPAQTVVQGVPRAGTSQQIFSDIPASHWAAGEINWASNMGYMSGNWGRFNPDGTITFQQMWMVLARLSGSRPSSMDEARNWAVLNGFAEGGNPTHTVARHQLVTALYRCAHILGSTNHRTASLAGYPDSRTVPSVARDPMAWAVANGIVGGNANGRLDPFGTLTRAQFAVVLYRFSQRI